MKTLFLDVEKIKNTHGTAVARAAEELQSLYTDGIYRWYASLWDKDIGGFYYSESARDNDGFLPDIESTAQLLGYVEELRICNTLLELPESMKRKLIKFIQGLQDKDDGYFYHPQWGKGVNESRKARDMNNAVNTLKKLGAAPLYPTAIERIERAAKVSGLKDVSSTVPEFLRSAEALSKYLKSFNINENSYSAGHKTTSISTQIKAAGLSDVCGEFLDSTQYENGLWEPELTYRSANGLMKISCAYATLKRPFPNLQRAFNSAVDIAVGGIPVEAIVDVFNPPYVLLNLLENMLLTGDLENYNAAKAALRDRAEELLLATKRKVEVFLKPNGSFSYLPKASCPTSQGCRASLGVNEGDVNGTSLGLGSRKRTLRILDIDPSGCCNERDRAVFFALLGES
ncbi:MAG: hypothetical protein IJX92_04500 [Clostridia bacterium]|nr:hypothetical protein [Clostridia bacterium]